MKTISMTFKEWKEKYKPIDNPFTNGRDIMFDTSKEENEFIKNQNELCIWTDLSCDGYNWIMNEVCFVNRNGYYVCEIPYEPDTFVEVMISTPEDWEEEGGWEQEDEEQD